ncbi:hypothetical protein ACLOJK_020398 [Asimina triloba]
MVEAGIGRGTADVHLLLNIEELKHARAKYLLIQQDWTNGAGFVELYGGLECTPYATSVIFRSSIGERRCFYCHTPNSNYGQSSPPTLESKTKGFIDFSNLASHQLSCNPKPRVLLIFQTTSFTNCDCKRMGTEMSRRETIPVGLPSWKGDWNVLLTPLRL